MDPPEIMDRADEKALHKKNKPLKTRKKCIREERHKLAELRTLIFKRYLDLGEKDELKMIRATVLP